MDPLQIFSEVTCEEILSYLSVKDLMNLSLVNKRYYDFIAKSTRCMKRVKIYLNIFNIKNDDYNAIQIVNDSKRNYVNIELYDFSFDIINSLILNPRFKTIKMKRVLLYDAEEYEKFFSRICSTIEELKLERYNDIHRANTDISLNIDFPKLHHLELHYMPHFFYQTFSQCSTLRELKITGKRDPQFYNILRLNPHLKKLAIVTNNISNFFEEDVTKFIEFKLLYFEARDIYNLTRTCIDNFKRFLESQINSLEEIDLGDWIDSDIVAKIFHMPRLKTLTFKGFHNVEEHINMSEINFHQSKKITTLNLIDTFSKFEILQAFVRACPNVCQLKLYSLKMDALIFLSRTLPNLKTLSVDIFEIETLNNECDFVHLKDFTMKVCHKNLHLPESSNNNFQNLVKKAIVKIEERNKVKFLTDM